MEVKIGNILPGCILIFCLWIFIKMRIVIFETLATVMKTSPGNLPEDQLRGCIVISIIILGLISALRLILSERDRK